MKQRRNIHLFSEDLSSNKGFSLVELIIVIAIMAILIGVMAPQLIKYIEKSNVAADTQVCDNVYKALLYSMMDPDVVTANDKSKEMIEDITQPTLGSYIHILDHYYSGYGWLESAFALNVTEQLGGWNPFDIDHATGTDTDYLKSTPKSGSTLTICTICNDDGKFAVFIQNSDRYGEKQGEFFSGDYDDLEDSRVIYVK